MNKLYIFRIGPMVFRRIAAPNPMIAVRQLVRMNGKRPAAIDAVCQIPESMTPEIGQYVIASE